MRCHSERSAEGAQSRNRHRPEREAPLPGGWRFLDCAAFARSARNDTLFIGVLLLLTGCQRAKDPVPLFELLSPRSTGVAFVNELPEAPDFNILNYLYYYNGGGVAVGDIDGDGLSDLYFSSNLGPNRLYRNKGSYTFEDVTERAGVGGPEGWKTGV